MQVTIWSMLPAGRGHDEDQDARACATRWDSVIYQAPGRSGTITLQ